MSGVLTQHDEPLPNPADASEDIRYEQSLSEDSFMDESNFDIGNNNEPGMLPRHYQSSRHAPSPMQYSVLEGAAMRPRLPSSGPQRGVVGSALQPRVRLGVPSSMSEPLLSPAASQNHAVMPLLSLSTSPSSTGLGLPSTRAPLSLTDPNISKPVADKPSQHFGGEYFEHARSQLSSQRRSMNEQIFQ
ncbi:hypothetical protein CYMTET_22943, partial [Cymbomonas tetramitiformis]